jgi:hypothetical protein
MLALVSLGKSMEPLSKFRMEDDELSREYEW